MMNSCCLPLLLAVAAVVAPSTNSCPGIKRDLIILLDSSSSVGEENFNKAKDFLVAIINELTIGNDGFQIGVVKFSGSVFLVAGLGQFEAKADLIERIRAIDHNGGGTQTGQAVGAAMTLLERPGNRADVPDQIITLTDGASDKPADTASQIEIARAKNIEMISIGVGSGINVKELRSLASNESLMYVVDSYDDISSIRSQLVASACGVMTTTTTTTTTTTPTTTTTTTTSTSTTSTTTPPPTSTSTTSPSTSPELTTTILDEDPSILLSSASPYRPSTFSSDASSGVTSDDDPVSSGREKDDMKYESVLSSAVRNWKTIAGIAVAAFAFVALTTGLVYAIVRRFKNKNKKRFVETL